MVPYPESFQIPKGSAYEHLQFSNMPRIDGFGFFNPPPIGETPQHVFEMGGKTHPRKEDTRSNKNRQTLALPTLRSGKAIAQRKIPVG